MVHSGISYKPGSLKARLCLEGSRALVRFCEEHGIPIEICGKVIVATEPSQLPQLDTLFRYGVENGIPGLRLVDAREIKLLEPHANGIRAIHVPGTGIVDYVRVAEKYAELIERRGGVVFLSREVTAIRRTSEISYIETKGESVEAKLVINCGGLHSDRISRLSGAALALTIIPFRGEYYDVVATKQHLLKGLLYPVPDPRFPFLGVHFTRRIGGGIEAGPNAVLAFQREGYRKTSLDWNDVREYAGFPGFWKMAAKHWRMSLGEYHRSWSKQAFVRALQRLMPELKEEDLIAGGSGVRAQALGADGKLLDDFQFVFAEGMVHVCNVPSPAATASLAIGRYIVDTIVRRHEPVFEN